MWKTARVNLSMSGDVDGGLTFVHRLVITFIKIEEEESQEEGQVWIEEEETC